VDLAKLERYRENWQDEIDSATQYTYLSESEINQDLKEIYRTLASTENKHAKFWEDLIEKAGGQIGKRSPSWRTRFLIFVAKNFSRQSVITTIAQSEYADRNKYAKEPETKDNTMAAEERRHSFLLDHLVNDSFSGVSGESIGRLEGRHKSASGNALRAAVLGANDGLCTNLSLVMGVAGASLSNHQVLMTGIAGLLAGAFSMAIGEFISVTSSRELSEREIRIEANELEMDAQGEVEELELIYRAKGLPALEAKSAAKYLMSDKSKALDTLTREELGINPRDLGGSAWEAATTSLCLFSLGAVIPVVPFIFFSGYQAVIVSVAFGAVGLFAVGALITVFTGKPVIVSGGRQLILGILAAALTFGIGRFVGAVI
jgi:VIT1/CCC1 family predicted Fe2+/Mn2+ transporter